MLYQIDCRKFDLSNCILTSNNNNFVRTKVILLRTPSSARLRLFRPDFFSWFLPPVTRCFGVFFFFSKKLDGTVYQSRKRQKEEKQRIRGSEMRKRAQTNRPGKTEPAWQDELAVDEKGSGGGGGGKTWGQEKERSEQLVYSWCGLNHRVSRLC